MWFGYMEMLAYMAYRVYEPILKYRKAFTRYISENSDIFKARASLEDH